MLWGVVPLFVLLALLIAAQVFMPIKPIPVDPNNCSSVIRGDSTGTLSLEDAVRSASAQVVPNATNLYDVVRRANEFEEFDHKSTLNSSDYIVVCGAVNEPLIAEVNGVNVGK